AAVDELTRDRSAMSLEAANREVYLLLKRGVKVSAPDRERGGSGFEIRISDFHSRLTLHILVAPTRLHETQWRRKSDEGGSRLPCPPWQSLRRRIFFVVFRVSSWPSTR